MSVVLFHEVDGALIPSEDGRLLCAAMFREEAAEWAARHDFREETVFIIGLGAGHHVRAWLEAHPGSRAVVIDSRPALLKPFRVAHRDLADRCEIHLIDSASGLLSHEIMETAVRTLAPVLMFAPAAGAQERLFEAFFATLTGRNAEGLRYFLRNFGFEGEPTLETVGENRLLTVKDLGLMIDTAHEGHPQASAVRVLRELLI